MAPVEEEITQDALVRAVLKALQGDVGGEGLLTAEVHAATGRSMNSVRKALRKLLDNGQLERCKRIIERLDGCLTTVTAYKLKDVPEDV